MYGLKYSRTFVTNKQTHKKMKYRLLRDGFEILGSDGIIYIDGRLNKFNTHRAIIKRNSRYSKNFPHLVATSYYRLDSRLNKIGEEVKI